MALKLADAAVYLGTNSDGLKKGLADAETHTQGWAGRIGGIAKGALAGVVAGAGIAAAAAVASVGKAAFDVSVDTDKAAADMAASLGIPIEKAEEFADVARRVYGNNFADSVGDAADAVALLAKNLDMDADNPALQGLAEDAFMLRDTFGTDLDESISAVDTLMEEFGMTGEDAFDFITTGMQNGLDKNGDFLDSIGEYSNLFNDTGFTANEFFSIMETGMAGGVLGTDKVSDAIKEMGIKLNEGGDDTKAAFDTIGLGYDDIAGSVASGETAWADYFPSIIDGLNSIEDPIERQKAQVAIFGTMAEDLGVSFTEGLSTATTSMADMEGATDSLNAKYDTFGEAGQAVWRKLVVAVSPMTDKLLELVNDAMPYVEDAFDWFESVGLPALTAFGAKVSEVVAAVIGIFQGFKTRFDENAAGRFQYFKDWLDENMPKIQQIVETVVGALTQFWTDHGDKVVELVDTLLSGVQNTFDTVLKVVLGIVEFWLSVLTGDWEGAKDALIGIVDDIWEGIKTAFNLGVDALQTIFGDVDWAASGRAIMDGIKQGIEDKWESVKTWFSDKLQGLRNLLPFSEPKDSSSPLRGLKASGAAIVEQMQKGLDSASLNINGMSGGLMASASGGDTYSISVNVGSGGTYSQGREVGRGILDELRSKGGR